MKRYRKRSLVGKKSNGGQGNFTALELAETTADGEEIWKCRCACGAVDFMTRSTFRHRRGCGCRLAGYREQIAQARKLRQAEILARRASGESIITIGRSLGISKQRVLQICNKE